MKSEQPVDFVNWLERTRDSADQSQSSRVLAVLRRGIGKEPGEDANVLRYIVPWLKRDAGSWAEHPYFLIATLFALHPLSDGTGDMGKHFRTIQQGKQSGDAVERRFTVLLNTHAEELDVHLRQAVSLCKANQVPVDWHELFRDVGSWSHSSKWVQRKWARSFWGAT